MRTLVSDESHWEGNIDWQLATPTLVGTYYKATDGEDFIDAEFGHNQDGCDETGLPHAPYHWWQELQNSDIQAHHFVETTQGTYRKRIVDVEPKTYFTGIVDKLESFLHKVEELQGFRPTIYTSQNYWNNFIRPCPPWASNYEFIVAQYAYKLTLLPAYVPLAKVVGWQFTDQFYFSGCETAADGNWMFKDIQQTRDWYGNYHPYNPPPPGSGFEMRVTADVLNIRTGPSASYPSVGQLHKGDVITVQDVAGQDAWIKHAQGWSCCKVGSYKYLFPKEQNIFGYLPIIE